MSGYLWRGKPDLERVNAQIMAERDREMTVKADFTWGGRMVAGSWRDRRTIAKDERDG